MERQAAPSRKDQWDLRRGRLPDRRRRELGQVRKMMMLSKSKLLLIFKYLLAFTFFLLLFSISNKIESFTLWIILSGYLTVIQILFVGYRGWKSLLLVSVTTLLMFIVVILDMYSVWIILPFVLIVFILLKWIEK